MTDNNAIVIGNCSECGRVLYSTNNYNQDGNGGHICVGCMFGNGEDDDGEDDDGEKD